MDKTDSKTMYDKLRAGEVAYEDFLAWVMELEDEARTAGYANGQTSGYEEGYCDAKYYGR